MFARRTTSITAAASILTATAWAGATPPTETTDRFTLSIRSETYAELFRRALLPGPAGAIVSTETAAPVHEYAFLRATDVDAGWCRDCIDADAAVWGRAWLATESDGQETDRFLDGDVQTASIGYRQGPIALRIGRQQAAGGAARWVRFDGVTLGAKLAAGLSIEGYGGFTALPRWDARPGYHHLGAAAGSLLRDPRAAPEPDRSGHVLAGGRLGWSSPRANAGASFHEQHETLGLTRRTVGIDGRALVLDELTAGAMGLVELDAARIQDARLWVDAIVAKPVDVSVEVLHTEPALFMSRQSVLAAFSTAAYQEAGGSTVVRIAEPLAVEAGGWVELYEGGRRGARSEAAVRLTPGSAKRTTVRIGYGRVVALDNGYHSVRATLARRFSPVLSGTLETYGYLYDEAILEHTTSEVVAGTLSWQAARALELTWGGSVAQSPYALVDAQTVLRLTAGFDLPPRSKVP